MTFTECLVHGPECYGCVYEITVYEADEMEDVAGVIGYCATCDRDREAFHTGNCDVCGRGLRFASDPREDPKYWAE